VNKKLFSLAAVTLSLAAGSALAGPNGSIWNADPSFDVAAKAGTFTRADANAQATQAQREARALYANADGAVNATASAQPVARTRADVKAETVEGLRVSGLGLVNTPY